MLGDEMKKIYLLVFLTICIFGCASKMSDYQKGIEATKNKQYKQAIALFNTVASTEKDKNIVASALYNAGFCYGIIGNFEEEVTYYQKALEASDTFQPALYDLGVYYKDHKDIETSFKMFGRLIEINPAHEGAFYMIGKIYDESGDKKKAAEYYKKAAELGSPEAQEALNKK